MDKLTDEIIKSLINANQVAICQLGKDIGDLNKNIEGRFLDLEKAHKTMLRDISDRWQMISDTCKEIDKLRDMYAAKKKD